jgi:hypothetical protein
MHTERKRSCVGKDHGRRRRGSSIKSMGGMIMFNVKNPAHIFVITIQYFGRKFPVPVGRYSSQVLNDSGSAMA